MGIWYLKKTILKTVLIYLEKLIPFYLSVKLRDKKLIESCLNTYDRYLEQKEVAILIQGPLVLKDEFTYQTLKLYHHIYPSVLILYSTWSNQDQNQMDKIKKLGVKVIINEKPLFAGTQNINLQIKSTAEALDYLCKETDVKYVLKTRSDQRISRRINFLGLFRSLLASYPISINDNIRERLIISGLNSFQIRLYGISDMLMFGNIHDMLAYWQITQQSEEVVLIESNPKYFIKNNIAEGYLVNSFFKTVDYEPKWTQEDSDSFIKKYFLIIEKEQIDLFWFKYERWFDNYVFCEENFMERKELNFSDWINIKE